MAAFHYLFLIVPPRLGRDEGEREELEDLGLEDEDIEGDFEKDFGEDGP